MVEEGPAALIGSAHAVGMGGGHLVARILISAGQTCVGPSNAATTSPTVVGHATTWWVGASVGAAIVVAATLGSLGCCLGGVGLLNLEFECRDRHTERHQLFVAFDGGVGEVG